MRIKDTVKLTLGSIVVYYVMAACSAPGGFDSGPSGGKAGGSSSGSDAATSSGGSGSSSGGSSSGSPVPDANADDTQSGSRLKANYFVGGDGSKQFAYFTDSMLGNAQCSFETAADGSIRCLPSGAATGTWYSNASCSVALAYTSGCPPTPAYAVVHTATGGSATCPGPAQTAVYPVTPYGGAVYYGTPASCTVYPTTAGISFFSLGTEIPASSFQQATIQAE